MVTAPKELYLQTETLAQAIRHSAITTPGLANYQKFVRAHLVEVIEQTFPNFNQLLTPAEKNRYVNAFVLTHRAIEAEFHHLATEFVRFMQQQAGSQANLLSLLEYEWVLFAVSIMPDKVESPQLLSITAANLSNHKNLCIRLNSTVYCLELPFAIEAMPSVNLSAQGKFFYAIFRDARHQVMFKPLNAPERYLIELLLQEHSGISYATLQQRVSATVSSTYLSTWLLETYLIHLIHLDNLDI